MSIPAGTLREHSPKTATKRPREVPPASLHSLQPPAPGALLQRAALAPGSLRPADFLRLQQTVGNRATSGLLNRPSGQRPIIQAKLTVNAPGDEYEQEADRVADSVMRMPTAQGAKLEDEDEEPEVMTKREPAHAVGGAFKANETFEQQLRASRGQGEPLPPGLQEQFEAKFGTDFSGVRVHADNQADQLNRSIQARAFTTRQDIYLGAGQYSPDSTAGKRLLAHELTHVVQQKGISGVIQRVRYRIKGSGADIKAETRGALTLKESRQKKLYQAVETARSRVNKALARTWNASYDVKVNKYALALDVSTALDTFFRLGMTKPGFDPNDLNNTLVAVHAVLERVNKLISGEFEIVDTPIFGSRDIEGYVRTLPSASNLNLNAPPSSHRIHLNFTGELKTANLDNAARVIIHEATHKLAASEDVAYLWDSAKFNSMTVADAITNADSYAHYAMDIGQ